jgi:lipopolysaccharide transport system ATP-binding protein
MIANDMKPSVLRLENLGKRYKYRHNGTILSSAKSMTKNVARSLLGFGGVKAASPEDDLPEGEFWALKNINFDVYHGDVVGIVGKNGAGKSTLLKILSRITAPTVGSAEVRGRIGALLEVGTGFNPELTGRENIFLSAAILGMTSAEVQTDLEKIIDFSGVERFLDMPVKHYSSGMYMRLAFSVAAHLRHEILLIDEVLAVGDAEFQRKCVGKISDEAKSGRTVLFVSHNMSAVLSLCNRAILLEGGTIAKQGTPEEVVDAYLGKINQFSSNRTWLQPQNAPGNHLFRFKSVRLFDDEGIERARFSNSESWTFEIQYWILEPGIKMGATAAIYDAASSCIFGSLSNLEPEWHGKSRPAGLYVSRVHVPPDLMKDGTYSIAALLWDQGYVDNVRLDDALQFEIFDSGNLRGDYFGGWEGVIHPRLKWTCERAPE